MDEATLRIRELHALQKAIRDSGRDAFLMLNDLAGSTAYKTRNGEAAWLSRLFDFYDAVRSSLSPHDPCKYLGDGVLTCLTADAIDASGLVSLARRIHAAIRDVNTTRGYRGEHRLTIRTILGGGNVHFYDERDPQGTPVDALFRMEKFVPDACIGVLDWVQSRASDKTTYVGAYRVKGLSDGRQRLWLLSGDEVAESRTVESARWLANLHEIWDLGEDGDGSICVINGYVPELTGAPATIQLGDMRAEQLVYANLVKVGRANDIVSMTTRDHGEKHLCENLICLGGPYWNTVTRRLMQELHLPLRFDLSASDDRTPLLDAMSGAAFEATWDDGSLARDIGFFVRARNPLDSRRHVIIAAGVETHAVGGAVEAFSQGNSWFSELCTAIRGPIDPKSPLPDFYCVLPFNIERTGRVVLPSKDEQTRHICREWDRAGTWPLQAEPLA